MRQRNAHKRRWEDVCNKPRPDLFCGEASGEATFVNKVDTFPSHKSTTFARPKGDLNGKLSLTRKQAGAEMCDVLKKSYPKSSYMQHGRLKVFIQILFLTVNQL